MCYGAVWQQKRGEERKITTDDSKVPVYIIPTDEELMIARDTYSILLQG